ncbi:MAG: hypothetical protein ABR551_14495 [Gemmatimonadales bacterium]|nr:hypothetical protein [Intrasporangiaceae bacterium]
MSAPLGLHTRSSLITVSGMVEGAVDLFDAAARMESRGHGDASAVRLGFADVFAEAYTLDLPIPVGRDVATHPARGYHDAWCRAILLGASALMCLSIIPPHGTASVFVAASAGWLAAQAASAAIYWGRGIRDAGRGARLALASTFPLLIVGTIVAVVTGWWEVPLWVTWGFAAAAAHAVPVSLPRSISTLAAATGASLLTLVPAPLSGVPAVVLVLGFGLWSLTRLVPLARAGRQPSAVGWKLVNWSVFNALALQAALLSVLLASGIEFSIVALAGMTAGIVGEPLLESCGHQVRRTAAALVHWRTVRPLVIGYGLVCVVAVGMSAAGAGIVVAGVMHGRAITLPEAAAAFTIGALSACSGLLMRVGTASGAALNSFASASGMWVVAALWILHPVWYGAAMLGIALAAALFAALHLASPGWW